MLGAKNNPATVLSWQIARSPRDGRYIEIIGFYNPRTQPGTIIVKEDRALYWLGVGAQPSEPVTRLLNKIGTLSRYERLRQGEALETLVAEAEAAAEARSTTSPKTRYPARSKAEKAAAKAANAEANAEANTEASVETNVEAEAVVDASADDDVEVEAEVEAPAEASEEPASAE